MTGIGGYLPLESGVGPCASNVFGLWNVRPENSWLFANARSALAHLLRKNGIERLWLPALICPELVFAAAGRCAVFHYPLVEDLSPDIEFLDTRVRAGDCVVGVDYFGRQPSPVFRDFVTAQKDILWVEDRAQALAPAIEPWARWVLYSPRKLFGVADGGILVSTDGMVDAPAYTGADVTAAVTARNIGQGDRDWRFALYQETERRLGVSMQGMSRFSREALEKIDPEPAIHRRRENFETLTKLLGDVALWGDDAIDFAPLGFPVKIPNCEDVWRKMCGTGVFPARHFVDLPSDPATFPDAHALGTSMMTLPCDQRYVAEDMHRVAAVFRESQK